MRAIIHIKEGEEITINYIGNGQWTYMQDLNARRVYLQIKYHFFCDCDTCNLSGEDVSNQVEKCKFFKNLKEQQEADYNAQIIHQEGFMYNKARDEVDCLKEMYKIAQELKILGFQYIIKHILELGFDASCQGFYNLRQMSSVVSRLARNQFLKDANCFASVGFQLSTIVNGVEHSTSQEWKERKADPIEYFRKEFVFKKEGKK